MPPTPSVVAFREGVSRARSYSTLLWPPFLPNCKTIPASPSTLTKFAYGPPLSGVTHSNVVCSALLILSYRTLTTADNLSPNIFSEVPFIRGSVTTEVHDALQVPRSNDRPRANMDHDRQSLPRAVLSTTCFGTFLCRPGTRATLTFVNFLTLRTVRYSLLVLYGLGGTGERELLNIQGCSLRVCLGVPNTTETYSVMAQERERKITAWVHNWPRHGKRLHTVCVTVRPSEHTRGTSVKARTRER